MKRFEAAGWAARRIDGHDPQAIAQAIEAAMASDRPSLIACRTTIGFGAPTKAGTEKVHGSALGAKEVAGAREKLGWTSPAFEIPADILGAWRTAGQRSRELRHAWERRLNGLEPTLRGEFERRMGGELAKDKLAAAVASLKAKLAAEPKNIATRAASEFALDTLVPAIPEMVGGSADLTGSNNTRAKGMPAFSAAEPAGRFVHYGIREHGMAAAMNGMALHHGIIPYSGTFLVFSDYCRPAIRLAALMGQRVIHVMTHDSIGLGEDGPTHQPVEHLAALRAIPNLKVFRPCDAVETVECWQLALKSAHAPSILALTRQNLPQLRLTDDADNRCAAGAYEIAAADGKADVSLFATGSEVSLRRRGAQAARRARRQSPRRLGAVLRAVFRGRARGAARRDRRRQGPGRGRSRHPPGLGPDHRPRRRLRGHDLVRRERARQGPLPAFRHYGGKNRRSRIDQARKKMSSYPLTGFVIAELRAK